jgi:hypothetical protein
VLARPGVKKSLARAHRNLALVRGLRGALAEDAKLWPRLVKDAGAKVD